MNTKAIKSIFLGILILNAAIGLFFGMLPLVNFSLVLELNEIPFSDKLMIFGVVNGVAILFLTSIMILSIYWLLKGKKEGVITGVFSGFYLLIVGVLAWIYTGDETAFVMDSIRGSITVFLGFVTYKSMQKSN